MTEALTTVTRALSSARDARSLLDRAVSRSNRYDEVAQRLLRDALVSLDAAVLRMERQRPALAIEASKAKRARLAWARMMHETRVRGAVLRMEAAVEAAFARRSA